MENQNPPWTKEDTDRLKNFVVRGYSTVRASAALKRSIASVRKQARKIGCPFPPFRIVRQKWADVSSKRGKRANLVSGPEQY